MKENGKRNPEMHAYVNHGLVVSSSDVPEPHGFLQGSNEFILTDDKQSKTKERLKSMMPVAKRKLQGACSKKMLYKRLPILNWLPKYNSTDAVGDLVAGITVGLTVIPQSLAYSNIAHLPPQYGLYSSFLGCLIYIVLGSCKDVPMGPTAIASLLTFQSTKDLGVEYAILLCFLSGVVEIAMGVLGLGFLIDFVSGPVASGFTSAVALIIVTSQVKDVLGIETSGSTFLDMWSSISKNISDSQMWDCVMGAACIIILLIMRLIAMLKIGPADDALKSKKQKVINKMLWLIGTARNAILVVVCGLIGYALTDSDLKTPFKVIGEVPSGLPQVMPPPFSVERNNETINFFQMTSQLGSGIIVVPLVSLLENIAICKAFANGKSVDATQELLAIGAANVGNSFVQGFPGTGSLSRGAVNNASGARTPLGGLYTGLLVIAALLFFTPYFFFIPKASLGAIIIAAVVFMVEVKVVKPMWRTKKSDLIPGIFTFVACLVFPLEYGILVGIGINVIFILYHAARPKISLEILTSPAGATYLMLTPDRCLIFPSVDYVRNIVNKQSTKNHQTLYPVVIDCSHVYGADYTAATVIKILIEDFRKRNQGLYFYNLKPSVCQTFEALSAEHLVVFYRRECLDDLLKQTESSTEKV